MPTRRTSSLKLLEPSERLTIKTRSNTVVRNADAAMMNAGGVKMKPSTRRGTLLGRLPGSREGAPSHRPLSYVNDGKSYPATGTAVGHCLAGVTTRARGLYDGQRVHGQYTEDRVLGKSGRGGNRSGLCPPNVRERVVAQCGRPFDRSGLDPPANDSAFGQMKWARTLALI